MACNYEVAHCEREFDGPDSKKSLFLTGNLLPGLAVQLAFFPEKEAEDVKQE